LARKPAAQSVNRDDILSAAAAVLQRSGFDSITMKDIAAEVNLTAASLYHHFRNKDMLLLAVLEAGLDIVIQRLEPITRSDQPSADKLRRMIGVHVISLTEHTAVGAAMIFEIRNLINIRPGNGRVDDDYLQRRDRFFARRAYFEDLYRQTIQAGIDRGEFRPVDVGIFTKTMLGAHNWVGVWYRPDGRLSGQQIAGEMADTFLRALAPA
jgi:AcrR family transcriptional regulator